MQISIVNINHLRNSSPLPDIADIKMEHFSNLPDADIVLYIPSDPYQFRVVRDHNSQVKAADGSIALPVTAKMVQWIQPFIPKKSQTLQLLIGYGKDMRTHTIPIHTV